MLALVTGASKGIGKAIAIELAAKGHDLLLIARSQNQLETTAAEIQKNYTVKVTTLAMDLSEAGAAHTLFNYCQSNNLPVQILVNNAGFGLSGPIDRFSIDQNTNMIQLNTIFLTEIIQYFLLSFKQKGEAYILNVASTASYQAIPLLGIYSATKSYVLSLSRALSHELAPFGIQVTALSPGATDTDFGQRAEVGVKAQQAAQKFNMTPQTVAKIGVKALFAGKKEAITGFSNKIGVFAAWLLPKTVIEKIASSIYK